jgi:galactokinase
VLLEAMDQIAGMEGKQHKKTLVEMKTTKVVQFQLSRACELINILLNN